MSTATAVKERPILFSGEMVRAILDGRKTQTRRIVKPQPVDFVFGAAGTHPAFAAPHCIDGYNAIGVDRVNECIDYLRKPYARPGDHLWVRESFYVDLFPWAEGERLPKECTDEIREEIYYMADGPCCSQIPECACAEVGKPKWRPSIHMPRWASRITLEVTSVRAERLNDISGEDAFKEGIDVEACDQTVCCRDYGSKGDAWFVHWGDDKDEDDAARESFQSLWESINGPGSWDANPWTWVIEFTRI